MSRFDFQAAIKITFDQPIVTDPVITGTEFFVIRVPFLSPWVITSSGDFSGNPRNNAFDGDVATFWRSSATTSPQWIGRDCGEPVTLTRVGVQMDSSSGRINAYEIRGSVDGIAWVTVASGNFLNVSGEQMVTFPATTYRHWRLHATSRFSSNYTVSELRFYGSRDTYNVAAWTVTGPEFRYQPGGAAVAETYTVRKVTKAPDNMSVTLWLDMLDRMTDPSGLITVSYSKVLGNLAGEFDAYVNDFMLQFTPTGIVPYSQPHVEDRLSARGALTVSVVEVTHRFIPAESNTFLIPDQDNPFMDEHLSARGGMIVVVTNVGGLPL